MKKLIFPLLVTGAALCLAGCVLPLTSSTATPGVSGRVVDAVTLQPVVHAELRFVQRDSVTPFDSHVASTDPVGRFSLRASYHYGGAVIWNPMAGGGLFWGNTPGSTLLLIQCPGYQARVFDLRDIFLQMRKAGKTPGAKNDLVFQYDGDLILNDIALIQRAN